MKIRLVILKLVIPLPLQTSRNMLNEPNDFVEALENFIKAELRQSTEPAEYNHEAILIADAHNHLFSNVGNNATDEALGIYAIRDLCRVDEFTLETIPDRNRLIRIAREYGLQ